MEARGRVKIDGPGGLDGQGQIILGPDVMQIRFGDGSTRVLSLRDITEISAADYQISLGTINGGVYTLTMLGNRYEDMTRELHRTHNQIYLQDRLMQETLRKAGVKCECQIVGPMSNGYRGQAEVRLYSTAIVILPENGVVRRIIYADVITAVSSEQKLTIQTERGCSVVLTMLGKELGSLHRELTKAMSEMASASQSLLKQIHPSLSAEQLETASRYLAEGKAARRSDVEGVSKGLWQALEQRLSGMGLGEEYHYLDKMGFKGSVRIGIKRGLGEEGSDYLWLIVPVIGDANTGNALVFEATSEEGEGRATYVFRILPSIGYNALPTLEIPTIADRSARDVAAALMAINFRREPIYLSDAEIAVPGKEAYQNAVRAMPELRLLRRTFAGRVMHSSPEQWKEDVMKILAFCRRSEDGQVWRPTEV